MTLYIYDLERYQKLMGITGDFFNLLGHHSRPENIISPALRFRELKVKINFTSFFFFLTWTVSKFSGPMCDVKDLQQPIHRM